MNKSWVTNVSYPPLPVWLYGIQDGVEATLLMQRGHITNQIHIAKSEVCRSLSIISYEWRPWKAAKPQVAATALSLHLPGLG